MLNPCRTFIALPFFLILSALPQLLDAQTTVTLTASPNPSVLGGPVVLSAAVTPASATGRVTFYGGVTVLGTKPLVAGATSVSTILLPAGNRKLRAYYGGDGLNFPAASNTISQTVNAQPSAGLADATPLSTPGNAILAVADFNGDGKVDIVINNYPTLSILLGDGAGNFHVSTQLTSSTFGAAAGDFNGDGLTDLALSTSAPTVSILLGKGDGSFQSPLSVPLPNLPQALAVADFNGDGKVDLVAADPFTGVDILLGKGDGTFQPSVSYPTSPDIHFLSQTNQVVVGDVNGDGKPDLVTLSIANATIGILLGNGDGSFQPVRSISPPRAPIMVALGDFNGDGIPDLATGAGDVLLGRGDGTFQTFGSYLPGSPPASSVALGDFNGDGKTDLALAATSNTLSVSILMGKGDGTFQAPVVYPLIVSTFTTTAPSMIAADFNGDGKTDLITGGSNARLLLGTNITVTPTTGSAQSITITKRFPTPLQVTVKDGATPLSGVPVTFTLPPFPDLPANQSLANATLSNATAVTDANGVASVTATANLYAGSYTVRATALGVTGQFALTNIPAMLSAITATNNQSQSVLTGAAFPRPLQIAATDPEGIPVSGVRIAFTPPATGASAVVSAASVVTDFLGIASVTAVANNAPGSYVVTATAGSLSAVFPLTNLPATVVPVTLATSASLSTFGSMLTLTATIANATANGRVTFYVGVTPLATKTASSGVASFSTTLLTAGVHKLSAYYRDEANLITGTSNAVSETVKAGAGGAFLTQNPSGLSPAPSSAVIGDFNGDGKADFAFPRFVIGLGAALTVVLGNGDGSFQSPVDYLVGTNGSFFVAAGDFNGDGSTDIAVTTLSNNASFVSILLNNGNGTFRQAVNYPAPSIGPLAIGDFNGDGKTDILSAFIGSAFFSESPPLSFLGFNLLPGVGDGTFGSPIRYLSLPPLVANGVFYPSFLVSDFNSDGKPDLAVGNALGIASPFIQAGSGNGTTQGSLNAFSPSGIRILTSLVSGDFNSDGKMDLAVGGLAEGNGAASTWIFLGNGDNTFQPGATYALGSAVASGDFNGDGIADLVVAGGPLGSTAVLQGKGDGTFQQGPASPGAPLSVADFNADGKADILTANTTTGTVTVLLGATPVTNPSGPPASIAATGGTPQSAVIGTPFTTPLQVTVKDSAGLPVGGAVVTFTAPATGPSATLSSQTTLTDAAGMAGLTATANNIPGGYSVTATVSGFSTTFALINMLGGRPNLALGKPASQSSDLGGYPSAIAASAVDGSTDGNFFNGSVTHTNVDSNAWWQVDLGSPVSIDSVVVWNRTDCCAGRLSDYWVFISNTPFSATDTPATLQARAGTFANHPTSSPNPSATITANGVQGRYVRIQLTGTNNLSLAEVQVIPVATIPPTNLAQGRAATQSSSYYPNSTASLAVDGNTDGNFFDGSVSHTNADINAWWQVDLGAVATIGAVQIWNRTDACCISRLSDYWVFVSDAPFGPRDTPTTLQNRAGTLAIHQNTAPNPSALIPIGAQGRYVRIQLTGQNYLNLAEVQVFGTGGPPALTNLSVGKATSQSSTLSGYSTDGSASAVDGSTDGNFFDGSVTHTNLEANAWWQVDLGASSSVNSVVVWNRIDCCTFRLQDYWIFVSDTPFLASDTPATLQNRAGTFASHQAGVPVPSTTIGVSAQGRYVRVQLNGTDNLSLAEVQVFGTALSPPSTNLAVGKTASQSSTLPDYPTTGAGGAVDGNIDGNFFDGSVTHTNFEPNPWWQVDLGASATVNSVALWNRTDACCVARLNDYWVFVSDTPFLPTDTPATLQTRAGTFASHQTSAPPPSTTIPVGATGRYVRVQLSGTNNLSLAEVQVFGQ